VGGVALKEAKTRGIVGHVIRWARWGQGKTGWGDGPTGLKRKWDGRSASWGWRRRHLLLRSQRKICKDQERLNTSGGEKTEYKEKVVWCLTLSVSSVQVPL